MEYFVAYDLMQFWWDVFQTFQTFPEYPSADLQWISHASFIFALITQIFVYYLFVCVIVRIFKFFWRIL